MLTLVFRSTEEARLAWDRLAEEGFTVEPDLKHGSLDVSWTDDEERATIAVAEYEGLIAIII